ncbi:hypothetical protein [Lentzea cavernae]|uniref:Uncharacterized protein n=1 Tax=Lentzea cavernae TaxID=2020703 RepID=A0ABQ3MSD5_9PSEU|nr:hypothetical protein [Lentzea cavernae]GHH57711.1 hypothetical protein GCM10017774_77740 [Lentzea cavernae]
MGFPRKRRYNLTFLEGDPITDGLEVKTTAPTLLESLEFKGGQRKDEEDRAYFDRQFRALIDHIVDWNIEDEDGVKLPITLDDWYTIDLPVQMRILHAWSSLEEVVDEQSPLDGNSGRASTSGSSTGPDLAIEASIPSQPLG